MDRETERLLNLYLDDQLIGADRQAFEIRLKQDSELRKAVELHREAAAELRRMPDLPDGFAARARARLDRALPQKPAGRLWNRFWSLETAGLLAAAGIVIAVLYPFLKSDETGQLFPQKPVAEFPATPAPEPVPEGDETDLETQMLNKNQPTRLLSADDRKDAMAPVLEPAGRIVRDESIQDKGEVSDATPALGSNEINEGPPAIGNKYYDVLTTQSGLAEEAENSPKESTAEGREPLAVPAGEKKTAAESIPGPKTAAAAESFSADLAALADPDGGAVIPFRVVQAPGTVDLGKRGFVSLKKEADFDLLKRGDLAEESPPTGRLKILTIDQAREGILLGIDLKKEMGVLVAARRQGDPPVRIEVTGARRAESRILIQYREIPVPANDASWRLLPDYQVVILPASELPIELQKID